MVYVAGSIYLLAMLMLILGTIFGARLYIEIQKMNDDVDRKVLTEHFNVFCWSAIAFAGLSIAGCVVLTYMIIQFK